MYEKPFEVRVSRLNEIPRHGSAMVSKQYISTAPMSSDSFRVDHCLGRRWQSGSMWWLLVKGVTMHSGIKLADQVKRTEEGVVLPHSLIVCTLKDGWGLRNAAR